MAVEVIVVVGVILVMHMIERAAGVVGGNVCGEGECGGGVSGRFSASKDV